LSILSRCLFPFLLGLFFSSSFFSGFLCSCSVSGSSIPIFPNLVSYAFGGVGLITQRIFDLLAKPVDVALPSTNLLAYETFHHDPAEYKRLAASSGTPILTAKDFGMDQIMDMSSLKSSTSSSSMSSSSSSSSLSSSSSFVASSASKPVPKRHINNDDDDFPF
jgi:hypothetical protein